MSNQSIAIRDDMNLTELGTLLAKSGFFTDTREAGQAIVKVLAGRELGFGPVASMTGINIIKGRVSVSANLMAAAVKRTGKYNYRVTEHTDKACEIAFYEGKDDIGHSRFTIDDAKRAGTQNLDKFPRNMLFARAMSNGVKWYCPDVFGGPIYTPDEMGATPTDDDGGQVIEQAEPRTVNQDTGEVTAAPAPAPTPEPVKPTNGTRPYAPAQLKKRIDTTAATHAIDKASQSQLGLTAGMLTQCFAGDEHSEDKRHSLQKFLTGHVSLSEMGDEYVLALLDWLKPTKDSGGAYSPDPMAVREAGLVIREVLVAAGQAEMALA